MVHFFSNSVSVAFQKNSNHRQEYDFNKGNYTVQNVVDRSTLTLGQQWKFVPNVRLLMENIVKDQTRRKVTLIKSSNLIIDHTCVIENY